MGVLKAVKSDPVRLVLGRRELAAMIGGALLYALLSWVTNVFHMQAAADLQIRPGVAVPIFFGFVYGPIVGFVVGALGNFLGDFSGGLLPYPPAVAMGNPILDPMRAYLANWQMGNGLMGLIPGLAAMYYRRYFTLEDQFRAVLFAALGIVAGIGFAAFSHPFVDPKVDLTVALNAYFLPVIKVNLINAIVLVPILLFNYARFDLSSMEWTRSGLMRRLLLAIVVSAALPVCLLGLFLTQQAGGAATNPNELMGKLGFTVVLSLLFTLANAGLVAQSMSRPLLRLTEAARLMEAGKLDRVQASDLQSTGGSDEISRLSSMFGRMALEVMGREAKLRQQVEQLRIEIDESKKAKEVSEIVDSDYFQSLQNRARQLREKRVDRSQS